MAISDAGIIEHEGELPGVRKADQVPHRARELIDEHRRLANPFAGGARARTMGRKLSEEEVLRVRDFLLEQDRSGAGETRSEVQPMEVQPAPTEPALRCRACDGSDLEIRYGRNYYFRCRGCQANTPIRLRCTGCNGPARIRKDGDRFYRDCPGCGLSAPYFQNPATLTP